MAVRGEVLCFTLAGLSQTRISIPAAEVGLMPSQVGPRRGADTTLAALEVIADGSTQWELPCKTQHQLS